MKSLPNSCIGVIESYSISNCLCIGTGFLIAPNIVATVAHNIFCPRVHKFNSTITFRLPSYSAHPGKIKVVDKRITPEYEQLEASKKRKKEVVKFDYALLKLEIPVKMEKYLSLVNKFDNDL